MSIITKLIFIMCLAMAICLGQDIPKSSTDSSILLNFFLKKSSGKYDFIAKNKSFHDLEGQLSNELAVGLRRKILPGFHLGLLYMGLNGIKNNDNWVFESNKWQWKIDNKLDSVIALEARYKFIAKQLAKNVFQLESVFHHHLKGGSQSVKFGFSSTYFVLEDMEPKYSFILNYYHFLALNFARDTTYRQSSYFTVLRHYSEGLSLGPTLGYQVYTWTESAAFKERTGGSYKIKDKQFVMGISLNYQI